MSLSQSASQPHHSANLKQSQMLALKDHAETDRLQSQFQCTICSSQPDFVQYTSFKRHLRQHHCKVEGGSFVCLYGTHGVCPSLPLEGVNASDYDQHVMRQHSHTVQLSSTGSSVHCSSGHGSTTALHTEEAWGIYSAVQNLPSVLHDPKKGMMRDFFTKTWGETFVELRSIPQHVALPQVLPRHVESYNRRMRRRSRNLQQKPAEPLHSDPHATGSLTADPLNPAGHGRAAALADIPALFFSSSFNLDDPATFYSVFPHLAAGRDVPGGALDTPAPTPGASTAARGASVLSSVVALSSASDGRSVTQLQDKLLQHLEAVEGSMSAHIALKSGAFFQSMSHLGDHLHQLRSNHSLVLQLRDGIARLHEAAVVTPARLLALPRRARHIRATARILEMMSAVRAVQNTIQVMLGRREFITALDLITTASQLIASDLTTIRSFRNVSAELSEQVSIIEKMVRADFVKYVSEDLNRPFDDRTPLLQQDQLIAVVFGVLRLSRLDFLDSLREETSAAINATFKQCVAEHVSASETPDDEAEAVGGMRREATADQARHLPFAEWLSLLRRLTSCLTSLLQRHSAMVAVMVQAVQVSAGRGEATSEVKAASIVHMASCGGVASEWCDRALRGLADARATAADFAHDRCGKLLHARSRDAGLARATVQQLQQLCSITEDFCSSTTQLCGRSSTALSMALQGHCVAFVQSFHADREVLLRASLSTETWHVVRAPPALQQQLVLFTADLPVDATATTNNHSCLDHPAASSNPTINTSNHLDNSCNPAIASCDHLDNSSNPTLTSFNPQANLANPPYNKPLSDSNDRLSQEIQKSLDTESKEAAYGQEALRLPQDPKALYIPQDKELRRKPPYLSMSDLSSISDQNKNLQTPPELGDVERKEHEAAGDNFTLGDDSDSCLAPRTVTKSSTTAPSVVGEALVVEGEEYLVVAVSVVVVRLVVEYAECAATINQAAPNLLSNLADLLRRYNCETCRLLLEAGAVCSGGLRTVTTRHLALAHRSLRLLRALLPHVLRRFLRCAVKPATATKTIAQLERELGEHCAAIEDKIVGVAAPQAERCLEEWVARSPVPSPSITSLLRVLTRLHQALATVLTHRQVCRIFARLTEAVQEAMRSRLLLLGVQPVGPQSWVVTSELTFYFNHLASLRVDLDVTQEQFSRELWRRRSS